MSTTEEIKQQLLQMDPNLSPVDEAYKAAMVMLYGSINYVFTVAEISQGTGIEYRTVKEYVRNIKRERIWRQDLGRSRQYKVFHSGWLDEDGGGIAFWIDVNRALGYITAVSK